MSKSVCLNGIIPVLVDIPRVIGERGASQDVETVRNFDKDEHILRPGRDPKDRRGDRNRNGGKEEEDIENDANAFNNFCFREGWQETHGETGEQIYHCQR